MTTTTTDPPRIYVASLSDYNDGILHGQWINADQPADEIWHQIEEMLARSPFAKDPWAIRHGLKAEEWAIHDHEGFNGIRISEYAGIDTISEMGQAIMEHGDAYIAWVLDTGQTDPMVFQDEYTGTYENEADFGYQWFDAIHGMKKLEELGVEYCVNWHQYGEGLLSGVSHTEYKGALYVFG